MLLCCYANVNFCHGRSGEEKHKWKERTQFFWYSLSYLSVYLSNHVCSSCSSTFRAKIHWNVLVLSAVYRKLLNYKMVNKIYFKDQCTAVFLYCFMMVFNSCEKCLFSKCIILHILYHKFWKCLVFYTYLKYMHSFLAPCVVF